MTKQEFIQQYKARRPGNRRGFMVLALAWGLTIFIIFCGAPMMRQWEQKGYFDWAASFDGYWIIGFFGFCLLFFLLARARVSQPGGVACPNCGEKLWGTGAQIALFVGNCGYCGEKVLDDPLVKKSEEP